MDWIAIIAGANAILALALTALALRAWTRSHDRRAAWMTAAMTAMAALAGIVVWQAWTQPLDTAWGLVALAEGAGLASLYIGALR